MASIRQRGELTNSELSALFGELGFISVCEGMAPLLRQACKASQVSDATLLVEGETGSGKQVLAQAIYRLDPKRNRHPFITVHCGSIQESLVESELFGHERGSFSGAVAQRKGLFQSADRGTLFLDDVNDLPQLLQPRLLDVLQRGRVRHVGSDREEPVDVRIIAACNRPLAPLVREGRFRADLFYRLDVIRLVIPPLRERPEDIHALVLALARRHQSLYSPIEMVDRRLVEHLSEHPFEGNVRELEHAVQRMLFAKSEGTCLTLEDWLVHDTKADRGQEVDLEEAARCVWNAMKRRNASYESLFQQIEKKILLAALAAGHSRREIAGWFRISERNLYRKLRACRIGGTEGELPADSNVACPARSVALRETVALQSGARS